MSYWRIHWWSWTIGVFLRINCTVYHRVDCQLHIDKDSSEGIAWFGSTDLKFSGYNTYDCRRNGTSIYFHWLKDTTWCKYYLSKFWSSLINAILPNEGCLYSVVRFLYLSRFSGIFWLYWSNVSFTLHIFLRSQFLLYVIVYIELLFSLHTPILSSVLSFLFPLDLAFEFNVFFTFLLLSSIFIFSVLYSIYHSNPKFLGV